MWLSSCAFVANRGGSFIFKNSRFNICAIISAAAGNKQEVEPAVSMETQKHKLLLSCCQLCCNMTGDSDYSKYDLARLQAELEQERELKEMLEESVSDLRSTMCELQERLHSVDGEGNEWKTRFETQIELNGQLERQISLIHERLEDLRGNPMDRLASIRSYDDMPVDTLRQRLKLLTDEKSDLQSQLMDCHLRIEQEGKAFHKTNDERRAYLSEIAKLSSTIDAQRRQYSTQPQRALESKQRGKQTSRKLEADSNKGKVREVDGGSVRVKGGGGGGATVERREDKKAQQGSRLPTLKHYLKHNP